MSAVPSVIVWAVWFGFTVAVILVDQRLRKSRAQEHPDAIDTTTFENKSPWPYLALGVFCGALPLPIYFYSTRRSFKGVLIGLAWVAASFALVMPIAVGAQWMARKNAKPVTIDPSAFDLALGDGGAAMLADADVDAAATIASATPPPPPAGGTKPTRAYCYAIMGADGPACTNRHVSAFETKVLALAAECESELDAASRRGRVKTDESAEAACVAAHNDHKPKEDDDPYPWRETCNAFVEGLVDKGAACRAPFECKSHLACVGYTNDKDGACVDPPKVGDKCGTAHAKHKVLKIDVGDHPECGEGAHCLADKCVARKAAGAACTDDEQCLESLACRVGKCGDRKTNDVGGACRTTHDCKATLRCHREKGAGKCVAEKAAGDACTTHDECKGRCEKGTCKSTCGSG